MQIIYFIDFFLSHSLCLSIHSLDYFMVIFQRFLNKLPVYVFFFFLLYLMHPEARHPRLSELSFVFLHVTFMLKKTKMFSVQVRPFTSQSQLEEIKCVIFFCNFVVLMSKWNWTAIKNHPALCEWVIIWERCIFAWYAILYHIENTHIYTFHIQLSISSCRLNEKPKHTQNDKNRKKERQVLSTLEHRDYCVI